MRKMKQFTHCMQPSEKIDGGKFRSPDFHSGVHYLLIFEFYRSQILCHVGNCSNVLLSLHFFLLFGLVKKMT